LAASAVHVVAVELDRAFARRLERRFATVSNVDVLERDILEVDLPRQAFRVFGNVPFHLTTPLLRRLLDDVTSPLQGADLLVQYEVARKRAQVSPSTLLSLGWLPWYTMSVARRLPAACFEPRPPVDAGLLCIRPRKGRLLPPEDRLAFVALLSHAFRHAPQPLRRSLKEVLPQRGWRRLISERGLPQSAGPTDLDVFAWVDLFRLVRDLRR
jgi:23S rRNA (adenine-N6)-dimethyltransferase